MCFSAGASFGASALIGTLGAVAIKKADTTPKKVFAAIPVFFAIQQLTEGFIWIALSNPDGVLAASWLPGLTNIFLFFAWILWPFFIPLSMYLLENENGRKKILQVLLYMGIAVSLVLTYMMLFYHIEAVISNYHIEYARDFTKPLTWEFAIFYFLPTVFSCFVSSVKRMWYVGTVNLASYIFTQLMFGDAFLSVWCFFAAISSSMVLVVILGMKEDSGIMKLNHKSEPLSRKTHSYL